jgi:hypothetical protein
MLGSYIMLGSYLMLGSYMMLGSCRRLVPYIMLLVLYNAVGRT